MNHTLQLNYSVCDDIEQFKNAMLDADVQPPETIIIEGKLNGAYVFAGGGING